MYQPQGHTIPSDQNSRTCGLAPQLSDGTNNLSKCLILIREEIDEMNTDTQFKQKMQLDMTFDKSMLKVLVPMIVATLILYALCLQSPECKILIYAIWYIGFIILFIKERTQVEINSHMIIVHRPLFSPLVINKKDIKEVHIKENRSYTYRLMQILLLLTLVIYLIYKAGHDLRYGVSGVSLTEGMYILLYEFWFIFLAAAIVVNLLKKHSYSNLLRVDTDKSNFIFYSKKPEEMKRIIETQETA
jgi:predicted neutral ceramidase superfamily lipid hydrolase